jgi:uncharacterized lipoprotein
MNLKQLLAALTVGICVMAQAQSDPIVTQSTSDSKTSSISDSKTTVVSPPPSAIAPSITSINSDICVTGVSGAAQTQIFGLSFGNTQVDYNCERLKLSKTLYDMGMKVAAVATMCQDRRVFDAMMNAGTPCPVDGKIGAEAKAIWDAEPARIPASVREK